MMNWKLIQKERERGREFNKGLSSGKQSGTMFPSAADLQNEVLAQGEPGERCSVYVEDDGKWWKMWIWRFSEHRRISKLFLLEDLWCISSSKFSWQPASFLSNVKRWSFEWVNLCMWVTASFLPSFNVVKDLDFPTPSHTKETGLNLKHQIQHNKWSNAANLRSWKCSGQTVNHFLKKTN